MKTTYENHAPSTGNKPIRLPVSEFFGELTLTLGQIRSRLASEEFLDLQKCLDHKKKVQPKTADAIAQIIKEWAISKGSTHFCHWFQPMNGMTAEKHDAFIAMQSTSIHVGTVIERFSGTQLVQGEPDASSLPSGGMRSTFEARGYTAWDHTSSLFIVENGGTRTLCIPSVFVGFHGQALDNKTPLLRSVETLNDEACEFLKLVGDVDVKEVYPTLGVEQEYFLLESELVRQRPDLLLAKRTLIGAVSSRGQKLADHYFGSIPERVLAFMDEMETTLYRLGIPVKTRHNEVAPSQYEMAPIFEHVILAADHNSIAMEVMKRVANRHGLACLFYEKPFAGVNGSGKHCNWSLANDKGENLLDPGRTPHQNLRFLAIVSVILKALSDHHKVISASMMSRGNELRLGFNEAPPQIFSVYLGEELEQVFESLTLLDKPSSQTKRDINLGITQITSLTRDYADGNRTSPCAFTGNKFEFRSVGAAATVAFPMSIVNAAIAHALKEAKDRLKSYMKETSNRDEAVIRLIHELYQENKGILHSGNSYSAAWEEEAKRRGLMESKTTYEGLSVLLDSRETSFLAHTKVLSSEEVLARYRVRMEQYQKRLEIENATLAEMIVEYVIPAVEHQLHLSLSVLEKALTPSLKKDLSKRIEDIEGIYLGLLKGVRDLKHFNENPISNESYELHAVKTYHAETKAISDALRYQADQAERVVSGEFWKLPRYRELLFSHRLR
ncbi:MAG: glutamine synthetase III [Pseudomonadota bacterium]